MPRPDAIVVGAGVSGLTTAVVLAERGLTVEIRTELPAAASTSAAAGAMWGPYLSEPRDRVLAWSRTSLEKLTRFADEPRTGVRLVEGLEASRTPTEEPDWAGLVETKPCPPDRLPSGFIVGWRYTAPLIDMPVYLAYLEERLRAAGGTIARARIDRLEMLFEETDIVVNCAGSGAARLAVDATMTVIRGQLVVTTNPGLTEWFSEDTGLSAELLHIYPHGDHLVLGGTAEPGEDDLTPSLDTAAAIVARCAEIDPRIRNAQVLAHRVGLRPTRPVIRCEATSRHGRVFAHNYGHGGSGVTLSWGCAESIADGVLRSGS